MSTIASSHHAEVDLDDRGVATVTIRNAKSMNILGTPVITELTQAIQQLSADPRLRVLVLRGSGDKAFVGGADIHEMAALTPPSAEAFISRLRDLCNAARHCPAPVIARLSGWTLGGGLELALCCDLRLSSTDAHYGMPEVVVGIPSVIQATLLPRLIGGSRSAWLLLTGESVDAPTALDWGLVHSLHAPAALDEAVAAMAGRLAAMGPLALRQQKQLMRGWEDQSVDEAIAVSVKAFGAAFTTGEPAQYMRGFTERRKPAAS